MLRTLLGLIFAAIVIPGSTAYSQQKLALVVGVSDYFHKNMEDLSFADNDATAVGHELERLGFDATILTGRDATRAQVTQSLEKFADRASKLETDSIVFLMFSGHGQELKTITQSADGKSTTVETPFFCPQDAIAFNPKWHSARDKTAADLSEELNLISLNHVIDLLDRKSNSRQNLLVVDACRSNPGKGKSAGITGGTAMQLPRGISMLFAAKSGQKSWESTDKQVPHGVMTHYLLKGLQGDALNRRSQLTWNRLVGHVREEVEFDAGRLAGGADRIQTPHAITNNDSVVILNQDIVPDLNVDDWLQESTGPSMSRFDPDSRYVIEFWPALTDSVAAQLDAHGRAVKSMNATHNVNVALVIADSKAEIQKLLDNQAEQKTRWRLSDVAIVADPAQILQRRYLGRPVPADEPQTIMVGQSLRRNYSGKLADFFLPGELVADFIGARAPELSVGEWVTPGCKDFDHDIHFGDGNIYVIDFWASWCRPCIPAMKKLAQIEKKYAGDGVRVIGVGCESVDEINKFLDRDAGEFADDKTQKTMRDVFATLKLASDNEDISKERFAGSVGSKWIPFSVVVGRTGVVEWVGHTTTLDNFIEQIVNGTHDRESFAAFFKITGLFIGSDVFEDRVQGRVNELVSSGDADGAISFLTQVIEKANWGSNEKGLLRWKVTMHLIAILYRDDSAESLSHLRETFRMLSREGAHELALRFVAGFPKLDIDRPRQRELLNMSIETLASIAPEASGKLQVEIYAMLVSLHRQSGDIEQLRTTAATMREIAPEKLKKSVEVYLGQASLKKHLESGSED